MVKFHINFTNRWLYTLITIIVVLALGVGVYAYGTNDPLTFGHSAGEVEGGGGLWALSGSDIYYDAGKVGVDTPSPSTTLDVNGTINADFLLGDGSGLTNIVARITGAGTCDEVNDGLLRYRSSFCSADDVRSSSFEVCMRKTDTGYGWHSVQDYTWTDLSCDTDGCPPGENYYECTGWVIEPGCYPTEPPILCWCVGPEVLCPE